MVNYLKELKQTWKLYLNNLIVLLPAFFSTIAFLLVLLLAGLEFLFITLLATGSTFVFDNFVFSSLIITLIVLFSIFDLVLLILINSYFEGMIIGMFKDVCIKRKTSMASLLPFGKKYVFTLFKIRLFKFFILSFFPLIILSIIPSLLFIFKNYIFGIIITILFSLIFIVYSLFIMFGFFFIQPIITTENNTNLFFLVKKSFTYSFQNPTLVFATFGVGIVLGILTSMALLPVIIIERIMAIVFPLIIFVTVPIRVIVQFFITFFVALFKFKVYYSENKIKK
ncbi:hypothetical protein HOC35_02385 [Candidatus Woesearchaeota archaeon]|jgi:hypothetical protein|nr:hypothetical protein [Candidatus Woesearchaeota archaeon]